MRNMLQVERDTAIVTVYSDGSLAPLVAMVGRYPRATVLELLVPQTVRVAPRDLGALFAAIGRLTHIKRATLTGFELGYAGFPVASLPETIASARPGLYMRFNSCVFSFDVLRVFMTAYAGTMQLGALSFEECAVQMTEDDPPAPHVVPALLRGLRVRSSPAMVQHVMNACTHNSVSVLDVRTDAPFADWMRMVPVVSLMVADTRDMMIHDTPTDDGDVLPRLILGSPNLRDLHVSVAYGRLAPATVAAIATKDLRRLSLERCYLNGRELSACTRQLRNLTELRVPGNGLGRESVAVLRQIVADNRELEMLDISRNFFPRPAVDEIALALCAHSLIREFRATSLDDDRVTHSTYRNEELDAHIRSNQLGAKINGDMVVPLRAAAVYVTGPLRERVVAVFGGTSPLAAVEMEHRLTSDLRVAAWRSAEAPDPPVAHGAWMSAAPRNRDAFAELRDMIRDAPAAPAAIREEDRAVAWAAYAVEVAPASPVADGFIHVATVAGDTLDAFLDRYTAADVGSNRMIVVSEDQPSEAQMQRFARKANARAQLVALADLPHRLTTYMFHTRLVTLLYSLEVLRSPDRYIPAVRAAEIARNYGPAMRLANSMSFWVTRGGGIIPNLPALVDDMRAIFASRLRLVRMPTRFPAYPKWYDEGYIFQRNAVDIFNCVLETTEIPADEAMDIMVMFGLVFPADGGRVVFPRFRNVRAAAYRVHAWLMGKVGVVGLRMDAETGSVYYAQRLGSAVVELEVNTFGRRPIVAAFGDFTPQNASAGSIAERAIRAHLASWSGYQ